MSDKFVQQFLGATNTKEALEWLQTSPGPGQRFLGEGLSQEQSIEFVQQFYDAGAQEVLAVEIDDYEGGFENTGKLVIELPEESDSRAVLLDMIGKIAVEKGFEPDQDSGQQYVFLMLD
ncbi:hypothetical protein Pla110_06990 [Polystyrenella longa]|uniref:Uncharacterized protein n=1 Tax=Polystyrenella longa TaxID=2528007 RepID=A0A518CID1_9PLAN|nr:hypothetical protein [Polystyrenella longa]QDU78995.1 hypothetical protein Pla110_06990 [Polystyrenella longa]